MFVEYHTAASKYGSTVTLFILKCSFWQRSSKRDVKQTKEQDDKFKVSLEVFIDKMV